MPVYGGSRYRGLKYTSVRHLDGSVKIFLHSRTPIKKSDISTPLKVRYVRESDMIDVVAHSHSGDERKWWLVADVNDILFPLEMGEGEIYIPEKQEFAKIGRRTISGV